MRGGINSRVARGKPRNDHDHLTIPKKVCEPITAAACDARKSPTIKNEDGKNKDAMMTVK